MLGVDDKVSPGFDGCRLCLGLYKTPKILHCLHSFCVECLEEKHTGFANQLICPSCEHVTQLRYRGVRGLTTNTFIIRRQYLKGLHLQVQSIQSSDEDTNPGCDISSDSLDSDTPDSNKQVQRNEEMAYYRVNPTLSPVIDHAGYYHHGFSTYKSHETLQIRHVRNELEDKTMNLRSEILGVTDAIDVINKYVSNWLYRKSDLHSKIQQRSFKLQKQIQEEEAMLLEQLNNLSAEKEFMIEANTKKHELNTSLKASLQAIAFTQQILSEGTEEELDELGDIINQRLQRNIHENVFLNIPELTLDEPETNVSKLVSEVFGELIQTTDEKRVHSPPRFYEIYSDKDPDDDLQVFETETFLISTSDFSKIQPPSVNNRNKMNTNRQASLAKRPESIAIEFAPCSKEDESTNNKEEGNTFNRFINLRSSLREKRNKILRAHSDSSNPFSPSEMFTRNTTTTSLLAWNGPHVLSKPKPNQDVRRRDTFHGMLQTNCRTSATISTAPSHDPLSSTTIFDNPVMTTNNCHDYNDNPLSLLNVRHDVNSSNVNRRQRKGTWRSLTLS